MTSNAAQHHRRSTSTPLQNHIKKHWNTFKQDFTIIENQSHFNIAQTHLLNMPQYHLIITLNSPKRSCKTTSKSFKIHLTNCVRYVMNRPKHKLKVTSTSQQNHVNSTLIAHQIYHTIKYIHLKTTSQRSKINCYIFAKHVQSPPQTHHDIK